MTEQIFDMRAFAGQQTNNASDNMVNTMKAQHKTAKNNMLIKNEVKANIDYV